jgi:hypothetical protein
MRVGFKWELAVAVNNPGKSTIVPVTPEHESAPLIGRLTIAAPVLGETATKVLPVTEDTPPLSQAPPASDRSAWNIKHCPTVKPGNTPTFAAAHDAARAYTSPLGPLHIKGAADTATGANMLPIRRAKVGIQCFMN